MPLTIKNACWCASTVEIASIGTCSIEEAGGSGATLYSPPAAVSPAMGFVNDQGQRFALLWISIDPEINTERAGWV